MDELLILVDDKDNELGSMDKLSVHQKGLLHRAFSIFIFNSKGELLLQQRAEGKYHSEGLWANTCCSHPRNGEKVSDAVHRRLREEMGMVCELHFKFSFIYKKQFDNGLTEHELDHVYFGRSDELPKLNKEEVKDWKYLTLDQLESDIEKKPYQYTAWLKVSLSKVKDHFGER